MNKPIVNLDTGKTATISGESLRKMLSSSSWKNSVSVQAHMMAVGNIEVLFRNAVLRLSRPDNDRNPNINRIYHFDAPMPYNSEILKVKMLIKEYKQGEYGSRIYSISAIEIEKPGSQKRAADDSTPVSTLHPGYTDEFNRKLVSVKGGASRAFSAGWFLGRRVASWDGDIPLLPNY